MLQTVKPCGLYYLSMQDFRGDKRFCKREEEELRHLKVVKQDLQFMAQVSAEKSLQQMASDLVSFY